MLIEPQKEMLDLPVFATLVTLMPDGGPQATVMWHRRVGDRIHMVAIDDTAKVRNLRRDPRATIVVVHPENGYQYIELRSTAEIIPGDREAREELAKIGERYIGAGPAREYPWTMEDAVFVRIVFTPNRVLTRLPGE